MLVLPVIEVTRRAQAAGFRAQALVTIVAIAGAESRYDTAARGDVNLTEKGEVSIGLTQINFRPSRDTRLRNGVRIVSNLERDPQTNLDPDVNLRNAYKISRGGSSFKPWSTFNNGAYKKFLAAAAAAAVELGAAGVAPPRPMPTGGTAPPPAPPVTTTAGQGEIVDTARGPRLNVQIGGKLAHGDLSNLIVGGKVDLSTSAVSEFTLELEDPGFRQSKKHGLSVDSPVRALGYDLQVVELEVRQGPAHPHFVLQCHPIGVVRLRNSVPGATTGLSPTDYMRQAATAAGLRFVGEPTAVRAIGPAQITDSTGAVPVQRLENALELGQRLARDLGFLAFESAGTYYFGSPVYLAVQGRKVQLTWAGASRSREFGPIVPMLTVPRCRATRRATRAAGSSTSGGTTVTYSSAVDRLQDITVSATIDRKRGGDLRPAMTVSLAGVPPFDTQGLLVSRVSYDLNDLTSPVRLEAGVARSLTAANRSAADDTARQDDLFGPPAADEPAATSGAQPRRIDNAERARLYGPAGDLVRYARYRTPWGINVSVHQLVLPKFKAACEDAHKNSRWVPRRIDSQNTRFIRGTRTYSIHSWAMAWDFFVTPPGVPPPGGVQGKKSAPTDDFLNIFKKYGFYLGQEFRSNYDPPHIEWAGPPP